MPKIHMRFPGGLCKALTFSYDDGVVQDDRLIKIFDTYGVKGTFNLNSETFVKEEGTRGRLSVDHAIALYKNSPHEVAVHTLTHPFLEQEPINRATYEILMDRMKIEQMFGRIVRGMAYPYGTYSDEVVEAMKACGIVYSRTTKATEGFGIPTDWLRLNPTCHHNCPRLTELGQKLLSANTNRTPMLMYVWGHSYEFDDKDNWNVIEDFCKLMSGRDDIWYATNIEIYDYVQAYRSLLFSTDFSIVSNPTSREVFFCDSEAKHIYSVKPGETLNLNIG